MTVPAAPPKAAVLGLGVIGAGMALNLYRAGVDVRAWNRGESRADVARRVGIPTAESAAAATSAATVTIVSVTDDDAVRKMMTGPHGILATAKPGSVIVNTSTVAPATDRGLAAEAAERGLGYVDAPVTGGAEAATAGTLTLLCGGEPKHFEQARPVLEIVSRAVHHFGPVGSGQLAKAVNGVILASTLLGVAEGVALASASGLDAERVVTALRDGAAASWVLSSRASYMTSRSFPPAGRLSLQLKDLRIAVQEARRLGLELPGANLVQDMETKLVAAGWGDEDISALVRAFDRT